MLDAIKERLGREDREEGFTLIELMVVVLIIGILMAIAIPTFLSAKQGAADKAVQSNLHNALTAEQSYYSNNQSAYGDTTTSPTMSTAEPNVNWVAPANLATPNQVSVAVSNAGQTVTLIGENSKYCFEIQQDASTGTQYGKGTPASGGVCTLPTSGNDSLQADETLGWK